jgi:predicted kinase
MDIIPPALEPRLRRTRDDPRPVALMTCGISGAGKSTLSKAIVSKHPSFTRLSIDNLIHQKHGMYGIDYDRARYEEYLDEAAEEYERLLVKLLREEDKRHDLMLDRSCWAREDRDRLKKMVEENGGRLVLVYLKASKEVLWRRILERKGKERDADSAFDMTEEIFEGYWRGFEEPDGEGEVVIEVV